MEQNDKSQLTLFLTDSCNLNCVYCYEHKDNVVMSFKCASGWIKQCLEKNNKNDFWYICLFGGEPLMQFNLVKQICEWTWNRTWNASYKFLLQTNGTLLSDEMKDWFCKNKTKIGVCLSLDGRRETHNKNRDGSFDCIDIDFFRTMWPSMPVKMTISRNNISSIKDDIVWLHEQRFDIRGSNLAVGEGTLSKEELSIIEDQLKQLANYYIANPTIKIAPLLNIPLYKLSLPKDYKQRICNIGTDKLVVVNADGTTSPCSFFSNVSSNKINVELQNQLNEITTRRTECFQTCEFAPVCRVCYAENYSETGNIYKPSKQRCKLMKMRIMAAMYIMANRIAKKNVVTYEDTLTIKSIQLFYKKSKTIIYETV